jgi:plasmid stability protein
MPTLTLNDVPDEVLIYLEEQAATSGRSVEDEATSLLEQAFASRARFGFGSKLRSRFDGIYGGDLDVPRAHSRDKLNSNEQ